MNKKETIPSNRAFGIFVWSLCILGSSYYFFHQKMLIGFLLLTASFIILIIIILVPQVLSCFNLLWFRLGLVLNKIMGFFIMGVIFFVVITPIATVMRIFGRDGLSIRQSHKKSYWQNATKPIRSKDYFTRQF